MVGASMLFSRYLSTVKQVLSGSEASIAIHTLTMLIRCGVLVLISMQVVPDLDCKSSLNFKTRVLKDCKDVSKFDEDECRMSSRVPALTNARKLLFFCSRKHLNASTGLTPRVDIPQFCHGRIVTWLRELYDNFCDQQAEVSDGEHSLNS